MKLVKDWEKGDKSPIHTPGEVVHLRDEGGKCVCEPKTSAARVRLMKHYGFELAVEAPVEVPAVVEEPKPEPKKPSKKKASLKTAAEAISEAEKE
jgi:hypothetical protein